MTLFRNRSGSNKLGRGSAEGRALISIDPERTPAEIPFEASMISSATKRGYAGPPLREASNFRYPLPSLFDPLRSQKSAPSSVRASLKGDVKTLGSRWFLQTNTPPKLARQMLG